MGKTYHILLIEDDGTDADLIELELNKLDIEVQLDVISRKNELVDRLENEAPDLIISDYNLSGLTGIQVLEIVREKYRHLPFILVSGFVGEEKAADAILNGASDYVMKENMERLGPAILREIANYEKHKQQTVELKRTKNRYESLVQSVNGIVWEADAETFEFSYVSPQAKTLLGYSPQEWLAESDFWQSHIHPDDRRETINFCHYKTKQNEDHSFEYRMVDANDEIVWLRDYVTVISKNGEPDRLRGLMVDISNEKKAERQRDKAYEIANIGHWELDLINEELFWSDTVKKIHEVESDFEPDLETGINFYKEGEHRQKITNAIENAIQAGESFDLELKIITANNSERWVRVVGKADSRNNQCVHIFGSTQDISERKEIEQKFRDVVEYSTNMFYRHDTNHVLSYVSPQSQDFLGCSPEEAKQRWTDFVTDHPVNDEGFENTQRAIDTGKVQPSFPLQLQKTDGETIWVRVNEAPITENGKTIGIVGSLTDITEQQVYKEKIEETNKKLKTAQEIAQLGYWEEDWETGEVYWSDQTYRIWGFDPTKTTISLPKIVDRIHPDDVEFFKKENERTHQEHVPLDLQHRIVLPDGSIKWLDVFGSVKKDQDGTPLSLEGTVQDITDRLETENKLALSEKRFKSLVQEGSDLIAILDENANYKYMSPSYDAVLGMSPKEYTGKCANDFIHDDDLDRILNIADSLEDQEQTQLDAYRFRDANNNWRWVESTITKMMDNPAVEGIVVNSRDVTEQIERQRELQESVERYEIVSKATSDTIWDLNLKTDTNRYNSNIYNMFGYEKQEVENPVEWWREKIHPEDRDIIITQIEHAIETNFDRFQMEYRFQCADGNYKYIFDRAFIVNDEDGNPIRMIGAMQDVTQQREEQKWLQLFQSAIANTKESVAIIEGESTELPGRQILYINQAFCEMTGYTVEEAKGETLQILNGPKTSQEKRTKLRHAMERWEMCETELINYRKDGEEFWIRVSMTPVEGANNSCFWVCIGRDITEEKQQENALRKSLEEKETLLLEIHHRVKNNLAVVSGMMQLQAFEEEDLTFKQKLFDGVTRIQTMGNIHELLYQSESFTELAFHENLKRLTHQIIDTFSSSFSLETRFELNEINLNINQAIPCSLIANEVITNVLKHAFKDREKGQLTISISEDNGMVHLSIKDDGQGFSPNFEELKTTKSLGIKLIDTLSTQLEADYNYFSPGSGEGAEFTLEFEKAKVKGAGSAHLM